MGKIKGAVAKADNRNLRVELKEANRRFRDLEGRTSARINYFKYMNDSTPRGRIRFKAAKKRREQINRADERRWRAEERRRYSKSPALLRAYERHLARMKAIESKD